MTVSAEQTADFIYQARLAGTVVDALPESVQPVDIVEAYAAQAALVELLVAGGAGSAVGYKVGCTNETAMDLLGADGPFFGQLLAGSVYASGATVSLDKAGSLAVEPEYAYVVGAAMGPRAEPYDAESVVPYLSALLPSIELVGGRFSDITAAGIPSIVADNALNAGWVAGSQKTEDWHQLEIADIEVGLYVDDTQLATGSATNVLGHPLNVVAWLANELNARGSQLGRGDYVTTGTCTAVERVNPGSTVRCDFGPLGSVSVQLGV